MTQQICELLIVGWVIQDSLGETGSGLICRVASLDPAGFLICQFGVSMKSRLFRDIWLGRRSLFGAAAYWSGIGRLFELLTKPSGAIVLMYHSVAPTESSRSVAPGNRIPPEIFERQMAFLSKYRRVVPLSRVVDRIKAGESMPAGTVCLTFDDGYLDNLRIAAPILEKFGLPATLYLATGYVNRVESQWADVLHQVMERRTADRLEIPGEDRDYFDLTSESDGAFARQTLHRRLLEGNLAQRSALLAEVARQLAPKGGAPRLTMTWDEVRMLRRNYPSIEIGGHTRDHIDLRAHRGEVAYVEISGCAEDLRRELDVEPLHFSFPYGRWCAETKQIVSSSGWQSAVGDGDNNRVGGSTDEFCIPRVNTPLNMTQLRFRTSGAYPRVLPNPRYE
jgi:peptidoglycan/xylan/chitin deacetylase (PgdA/CDA1 family)